MNVLGGAVVGTQACAGGWWAERLGSLSASGRVYFLYLPHSVPWNSVASLGEGREDGGTEDQVVGALGTLRAAVLLSV